MARVATSSRGTRPDGTPRGRDLGVVASAASSDRGWCRLEQEDRCLITPPLFAIADGVGGGQAGEVAAQIALGALGRGDTVAIDPAALLRAGCATADADIRRVAGALPAYAGMSTTLTAALVGPAGVTLCNIGDTRAYVYRAGVLHQLTRDHSFVAELVRRGALSAEKAEAHPLRSLITRCLGGAIDERPDLYSVRPHPGDVYLLCSDGLSGQVAHQQVAGIVGANGDLCSAARDLVGAANAAGGHDNVTVVLFRLGSARLGSARPGSHEHPALPRLRGMTTSRS